MGASKSVWYAVDSLPRDDHVPTLVTRACPFFSFCVAGMTRSTMTTSHHLLAQVLTAHVHQQRKHLCLSQLSTAQDLRPMDCLARVRAPRQGVMVGPLLPVEQLALMPARVLALVGVVDKGHRAGSSRGVMAPNLVCCVSIPRVLFTALHAPSSFPLPLLLRPCPFSQPLSMRQPWCMLSPA